MADHSRPDLCIIGAGALGIALAQHARRLGASVMLVDRGRPEPGHGPQDGLRLAALQASAAHAHAARAAGSFGISTGDVKISMRAVQERALAVAREAAPLTSHDRLAALGIEMVSGPAKFEDAQTLVVGETRLKPRSVLLATGAIPLMPVIPGLEEAGFFTQETILENTRKLTHLLVLGGDEAALALAQAHARLGAQVTLVPQGGALPGFDAENVAILLRLLEAEGVRVVDGGVVREIVPRSQGIGGVVALPSGDALNLDLSHILIADGAVADVDELGLDLARIKQGQGHFATGPLGQTTNRRVRVAGPAAGLFQWAAGLSHGRAAVEALVGKSSTGVPALPRMVMTAPALAEIGQMAPLSGRVPAGYRLHRQTVAEDEAARALGSPDGLVKVASNGRGRIVGASVLAPGAAELVGVLGLLMGKGMELKDLAGIALPDPSLMASLVRLAERDIEDSPAATGPAQSFQRLRRIAGR